MRSAHHGLRPGIQAGIRHKTPEWRGRALCAAVWVGIQCDPGPPDCGRPGSGFAHRRRSLERPDQRRAHHHQTAGDQPERRNNPLKKQAFSQACPSRRTAPDTLIVCALSQANRLQVGCSFERIATGVEPVTHRSKIYCSYRLSYASVTWKDSNLRKPDPKSGAFNHSATCPPDLS